MRQLDILGFDVVFAALSLHHMANPIKVLRMMKYLLNPGGAIIVRSADDGTKVAFPDTENRLGGLIESTTKQTGASDRIHGRKIYQQLFRAGFRNISIHVQATTTAGTHADRRHAPFVESFSYRRNYLLRALEKAPEDSQLERELADVDRCLEEFELDFEDESFFYLELDMAGIARLPPSL
jgi:SAM-dependent methyltransferase